MHIVKLLAVLALLFSAPTHAANPQVEIKTNFGNIVMELYPEKAPKTVQNFLSYVKDDYYTGTIFHRVIQGFMIQGGGFDKTFKQKPTRQPIENEAANGLRNETGTVAMARTSDPHSASAQFFINVADNASLNHTARTTQGYGYTVFGKVIKGMDVVNRIAGAPTNPGGPFPSDVPNVAVVIQEVKLIPTESAPAAGTLVK
ncbi:peptidyl-prolyl cis-trans isomerase A (cyclophilin A)/peptidyl-prolyl cis-trans isomerase B (cyclophilin B) [Nitrosospira sp. Nl5]|uniref:peptidylprolyl isomerase n=1 Tax=Nitrosospira sp. Nl5 TaxID=200120 RepID=UPI00087EA1F5|nr:peptidylprolyl isomerase [Nitrosospira sp. Nl5]SCX85197.1 peptidyl-prolyl cis-trans isomerase A (cyclophilin A)/peptidyl-prolyl cis-trans isomerase B (cyclophilin B) [Nitrosospira sp. Nl5]